jgi:hypothetical protein
MTLDEIELNQKERLVRDYILPIFALLKMEEGSGITP